MLKEQGVFLKFLKEKGLKNTKQRRIILEKFLENEGHLCAEELYLAVRKKYPRIGFSTIFRTLRLLNNAQLASEVNFTGKRKRFEHKFEHEHHDHFICLACGKTIEFANRELEGLQEKIIKNMRFIPVRHRFEIWGYCQKCSKKKR